MQHWILVADSHGNNGEVRELTRHYEKETDVSLTQSKVDQDEKVFDIQLFPRRHSQLLDSAKTGSALAYRTLVEERLLNNDKNGNPLGIACRFDVEQIEQKKSDSIIGTSADLLFFLAVLVRVRPNENYPSFAATGQLVEPKGLVNGVTGVPAKLRAALGVLQSNGLFIYPRANQNDLTSELLHEADSKNIKLCPVSTVDEAIELFDCLIPVYTGPLYLGLETFTRKHSPVYFGREKEIGQMISLLLKSAQARKSAKENETKPIVGQCILAPSGAGKSSFIQAGLLPQLEADQFILDNPFSFAPVIINPRQLRNDDNSLTDLKALLQFLKQRWLPEEFLNKLTEVNRNAIESAQDISDLSTQLKEVLVKDNSTSLWIVDQLEEIFTLDFAKEAQAGFAQFITELMANGVWIVASMRSDFYPQYQEYFTALSQFDLLPLKGEAIKTIIEGPAKTAKRPPVVFEVQNGNSLADRIKDDMELQSNALPLLEFALRQLYEKREIRQLGDDVETGSHSPLSKDGILKEPYPINRSGKSVLMMTFSAYEGLEGLYGAIDKHANHAYEQLTPEQQNCLPKIIRALTVTHYQTDRSLPTSFSYSAQPLKHRDFIDGSQEQILIDKFVEQRLFVLDKDGKDERLVRVAHEALLQHWDKAKKIIEEFEFDLSIRDRLDVEASRWVEKKNNDLLLYTPLKLEEGRQILQSLSSELKPYTLAFIKASLMEYEQNQKAERKRQRRKLFIVSGAAIVFLFLFLTAFVASKTAQQQTIAAKKNSEDFRKAFYTATITIKDSYELIEQNLKVGKVKGSSEFYQKVIERWAPILEDHQQELKDLNWIYAKPIFFEKDFGSKDKALAYFPKLITFRTKRARQYPSDIENVRQLAINFAAQGTLFLDVGNIKESRKSFENSIAVSEKLIAKFPDNKEYRPQLASALNYIAESELFERHPQEAIVIANRALENNPCEECAISIKIKLAHALLLDGQFEKAKELYLKIIKSVDLKGSKKARDQILRNFNKFREKGIKHPDMAKIKAIVN